MTAFFPRAPSIERIPALWLTVYEWTYFGLFGDAGFRSAEGRVCPQSCSCMRLDDATNVVVPHSNAARVSDTSNGSFLKSGAVI